MHLAKLNKLYIFNMLSLLPVNYNNKYVKNYMYTYEILLKVKVE